MSISITQTPATASLAQSPIVFSVLENTSIVYNSGFQYVAELYYWTGSTNNSASVPDYVLSKFPNTSFTGIFDFSRIINSTLQDLAEANPSNVKYYAADFYTQYLSGSTYITGSHVKSATYQALDGYAIFQEPIGQQINLKTPYWALMTDGPATQSALWENTGRMGLYTGINNSTCLGATITATTADFPGGNTQTQTYTFTGSPSSSAIIRDIPCAPSEPDFFSGLSPVIRNTIFTYSIQAITTGGAPVGLPIRFNIVCASKYPNIRVKFKNRYGQFDWFNFNMISRQSFNTERRTYQPQLGSWQGTSLSYQNYDSSVLNYISDSKQAISVQSDWVSEEYNDIFKQLLVSDEIYWVYDEADGDLRPITINTQSITFKTGVVDKVIQYGFDFNYGQAYKLII
jgi:hypothetical protein